jgi:hypothetical protein
MWEETPVTKQAEGGGRRIGGEEKKYGGQQVID